MSLKNRLRTAQMMACGGVVRASPRATATGRTSNTQRGKKMA
eukprot:CAMPEP_0119202716 /NCGR_PEP_ID=MMETSP1316-20130426/32733_1 /TAXON_ID=41880 /ORGANISM="Pycnococcus provasolii, Strain RCC2336" /LENGTH=41 /DNA_ID= /DNA_START= /DNA_END= /DNA_ORIENTATION=